jgi:adenine-specific DNA-methyltransferase
MDKLKMHSPNLTDENVAKIRNLFPGCVTEVADETGKLRLMVDFDQLRQEFSEHIVEGPQERYRLDWPGRQAAKIAASAPIGKTLRPNFEESVDFNSTANLFVEGDNLEALKTLVESYLGRVRMIYIDPPYNTGNDLVYNDDYHECAEDYFHESLQSDDQGNKLVSNPESNGRFHSDWLSMMLPRVEMARKFLRDDGVFFVSIGYQELAGLKIICDNVFGHENYLGTISRLMKSGGAKGTFFTPNIDYILVYARDKNSTIPFRMAISQDQIDGYYNKIETTGTRKDERYGEERLYLPSLDIRPNQRYWIECPDGTFAIPPGRNFPDPIQDGGKIRPTSEDKVWRWTYETYKTAKDEGRIIFKKTDTSGLVDQDGVQCKYNIYFKLWLKDQQEKGKVPPTFLGKFENRQSSVELRDLEIPFDYAKPLKLLEFLIEIVRLNDDDIVMDFFAGSSTTAHALMNICARTGLNARFIMAQWPEILDEASEAYLAGFRNIADISMERIRRAGKKVLEGECHPDWNRDVGFRLLRVDTSNMQDIYYSPDQIDQNDLLAAVDNIKRDRTAEDLLFQVLVDWGVDLTLPIHRKELHGKTVFFVDDDALVACFDAGVTEELVKEMASHEPLRVVFRDNGFVSDAVKINVEQIFRQLSPNTDIKSI